MNSSKKRSIKYLFELDTLIAYSSEYDRLHQDVAAILDSIIDKLPENINIFFASSALLEYSLLLKSKQVNEEDIAETLVAWENFPNIQSVSLSASAIIKSLLIMDEYQISFFDSLHVATAITEDMTIVGSDEKFEQVNELKRLSFNSFYAKYFENLE